MYKRQLYWFAERAQQATFVCESYDVTLSKVQQGGVVYCDPPYAPLSTTANFTAYHTNSFSMREQQHLAELASALAHENSITVLISNHDTPLTRQWYQDAVLHEIKVRRSISRSGNTRSKVNELLALYTGR